MRTEYTLPTSQRSRRALKMLTASRDTLARALDEEFTPYSWLRNGGDNGGGTRLSASNSPYFHQISLNISSVHYEDQPDKPLRAANALSAIMHPTNPRAPSMHMHISWTEKKDDTGYWRIMADLNPAIPLNEDNAAFANAIADLTGPEPFQAGVEDGDLYFFIPPLDRHRGAFHFYLEGYNSGDFEEDFALAQAFAKRVSDVYAEIFHRRRAQDFTPEDQQAQLAYHTVYLYQVLTLDRGTTSGLLVHNQNDGGILGSLPAFVDRTLLAEWIALCPAPQDKLVRRILDVLPEQVPTPIDHQSRLALAQTVREHYQQHPEALGLQASGSVAVPTVQNHLPSP